MRQRTRDTSRPRPDVEHARPLARFGRRQKPERQFDEELGLLFSRMKGLDIDLEAMQRNGLKLLRLARRGLNELFTMQIARGRHDTNCLI